MMFLGCVIAGASIGFFYSWLKLSGSTNRAVADIRSVTINEDDADERKARAAIIGHTEGLRIGASLFMAAIGGGAGFAIWIVLALVRWLTA